MMITATIYLARPDGDDGAECPHPLEPVPEELVAKLSNLTFSKQQIVLDLRRLFERQEHEFRHVQPETARTVLNQTSRAEELNPFFDDIAQSLADLESMGSEITRQLDTVLQQKGGVSSLLDFVLGQTFMLQFRALSKIIRRDIKYLAFSSFARACDLKERYVSKCNKLYRDTFHTAMKHLEEEVQKKSPQEPSDMRFSLSNFEFNALMLDVLMRDLHMLRIGPKLTLGPKGQKPYSSAAARIALEDVTNAFTKILEAFRANTANPLPAESDLTDMHRYLQEFKERFSWLNGPTARDFRMKFLTSFKSFSADLINTAISKCVQVEIGLGNLLQQPNGVSPVQLLLLKQDLPPGLMQHKEELSTYETAIRRSLTAIQIATLLEKNHTHNLDMAFK